MLSLSFKNSLPQKSSIDDKTNIVLTIIFQGFLNHKCWVLKYFLSFSLPAFVILFLTKNEVLKITNMTNSQLPAIKRRQIGNWHDGINYICC